MTHASPSPVPVAIVYGRRAGLSLSFHLKGRGIEHIVFGKETAMHV